VFYSPANCRAFCAVNGGKPPQGGEENAAGFSAGNSDSIHLFDLINNERNENVGFAFSLAYGHILSSSSDMCILL
jgi:hypothetical protein